MGLDNGGKRRFQEDVVPREVKHGQLSVQGIWKPVFYIIALVPANPTIAL